MILYLDSSALAKRYLAEEGSAGVERLVMSAKRAGTSILARVEVSAALARARRQDLLEEETTARLLRLFAKHWTSLLRLSLLETTVERAERLAWDHGLRGYDAVHLASALLWRESLNQSPTFATFGKQLWDAARQEQFEVWPERL